MTKRTDRILGTLIALISVVAVAWISVDRLVYSTDARNVYHECIGRGSPEDICANLAWMAFP